MPKKFVRLNDLNYKYLQQKINDINPHYYLSSLNLLLWKNYGIKVNFLVDDDAIYMYAFVDNEININNHTIKGFYLLRPIFKKDAISYHYIINSLKYTKHLFKGNDYIYFDRLFEKDLKFFKNYEIITNLDSSYLYLRKNFVKFPGKKMQKKRNFYNFYVKNFEQDTTFKKYTKLDYKEVLEFTRNHIIKYNGELREYEINYIRELLETFDDNISGLLMYYKNKLIGATIGYTRNDIYEIFLEKADRDFKGSYQYLLSKNLEINDIKTTFVDRQDSEHQSGLEQSKKSYKPFHIVFIYLIRIKLKNDTN